MKVKAAKLSSHEHRIAEILPHLITKLYHLLRPQQYRSAQLPNSNSTLATQGKYEQAGALLARSRAIREELACPEHPSMAYLLDRLAGLLVAQVRATSMLNREAASRYCLMPATFNRAVLLKSLGLQ